MYEFLKNPILFGSSFVAFVALATTVLTVST